MEDRPGCDRLGDLAPDDALCLGGILDLVADRNPLAQRDQTGQIVVEGFGRDAGKRNSGRGPVVSGRECQPE